jgi:hypothetical protein
MYARYLGTEQQLKWRIKQTFIRGRWVVKHGIHYFNAKRGCQRQCKNDPPRQLKIDPPWKN